MTNTPAKTNPQAAALTSPDMQAERLAQLQRLMPDLFDGEGKLDEAALRALTQPEASAPVSERFRFEWAGKYQSKRFAFAPSRGTLVADKARSVDFDSTQNLIIEGDNLEVLKLLQATYFERVKCIYIDPPYNTGNDFIYPDNFGESKKAYWMKNGTIKDGVKLSAVTESNGRRHSNWLNMMQARLLLARQLLRPDGVIFISIDDNEQANLKKLCDEVFGDENFVACLAVQLNPRGRHLDKFIARTHEAVLIYTKDSNNQNAMYGLEKEGRMMEEYNLTDEKGLPYRQLGLRNRNQSFNPQTRPNLFYPLFVDPVTKQVSLEKNSQFFEEAWPITSDGVKTCWTWGKEKVQAERHLLETGKVGDDWRIFRRDYLYDSDGQAATTLPKSLWIDKEINNDVGKKAIKDLFGKSIMDFPKSPELIKKFLRMSSNEKDIVLDFFSGSGTLAQAVMQANAEDEGQRRFVLVQIPEYTDEASAAYQAGYKTISSLCIERVKRAGAKIREEQPDNSIDTGFRVFRLTDSHFPENLFTPDPAKTKEENLAALEAHLKAPRQQSLFAEAVFEDVVTELAIKNGFGLFYTLNRLDAFTTNAVYRLSGKDKTALLCLDEDLKEATLEQLQAHSDEQLFCSRRALDTTKKWTLQAAFKDNLWVV